MCSFFLDSISFPSRWWLVIAWRRDDKLVTEYFIHLSQGHYRVNSQELYGHMYQHNRICTYDIYMQCRQKRKENGEEKTKEDYVTHSS